MKTLAALALTCALALSACAKGEQGEPGHKAAREGLAIPLDGIEYTVFITRELNTAIPPDSAYYKGPPAPRGQTFYGVFVQVCNRGKRPHRTTDRFHIEDNQGNRFDPIALPADNQFAYHAQTLAPDACIPQAGSVAQLGPTAGSMLLFQIPLANAENRPLELVVEGVNPAEPKDFRTFTLDI